MALAPLTLLDVAIRNGYNVASVVDDVPLVCPEWNTIPSVTREGVSYDVLRRIGLPHGQFRPVGSGVPMLKSEFARETKPMFYFDTQMRVGQDIIDAQTAQTKQTEGDILVDEAAANVAGSAPYIGYQTWYGQSADPNGFYGLQAMGSASTGSFLNAGSTVAGATSSAYLCWLDDNPTNPQGVHYIVGMNGRMTFREWTILQTIMGQNALGANLYATAWTSGFSFFIGLNVASAYSVFQIYNIDQTHPLTDALGAALVTAVPLNRRMKLRWFMNRYAAQTLQTSRAGGNVAVVTPGVPGAGIYAALPDQLAGFPITVTDSLLPTETNGIATPNLVNTDIHFPAGS